MIPGVTSCYECSLDMITPQTKFPICTLANTPRVPEHCIEWASVLEWPRLHPSTYLYSFAFLTRPIRLFINCIDERLDMDNPQHVSTIYEWAQVRAKEYNIQGAITYASVLGVVKNIIPAIASTNAIIAGIHFFVFFSIVNG
jgi:ubiquitin-activating enzyme E1 C